MRILFPLIFILLVPFLSVGQSSLKAWIRVNQLGYTQQSNKVAVFVSKEKNVISKFELINARTSESILAGNLEMILAPMAHSLVHTDWIFQHVKQVELTI